MTIQPITDKAPACYGVACHLHADCSRYQAVDHMPAGAIVIGTCATSDPAERPLFLRVKAVPA